mgnify:CR=1 FL=1
MAAVVMGAGINHSLGHARVGICGSWGGAKKHHGGLLNYTVARRRAKYGFPAHCWRPIHVGPVGAANHWKPRLLASD